MTDLIEYRNDQGDLSSLKVALQLRSSQIQCSNSPQAVSVDEVDNRYYWMEEVRLRSYDNWPVPFMDPAKLAAAGFYYTGYDDVVRCFECKLELSEWCEGDCPMADHQRWQDRCRFIRKIPCGNIPIGESAGSVPPPTVRNLDDCGPYGIDRRVGSSADCHSASVEARLPSSAKLGSLGIIRTKKPVHPKYMSKDARLGTFESWPTSMSQTKESLADAGFCYTENGDETFCYHCGGGLKEWSRDDDPWVQHAIWYPKCYYLLTVKGHAYVNKLTGKSMAMPSEEETMQMNLPSCIKKVEPKVEQKVEPKVEPKVAVDTETKAKEVEKFCEAGPSGRSSPPEAVNADTPEIVKTPIPETNGARSVNKTADAARTCKICYGEELGVVFIPCGHIVACVSCALGMLNCTLCRQPITMTVRTFFS